MRKICVVTGSRAEYGLLKNLLSQLKKDRSINLQLIVTGSHLSKFYGNTYKEIQKDGFNIDKKIFMPLKKNNTKIDISRCTGKAISSFSHVYNNLKPDIVVILGDRFEIFAAVFSAMNANIQIAHIHGGEKTLGSVDEIMRHSITKMSTWHFVSTLSYKKRVIQLGENPKNVFHVGGLAYESIKNFITLEKKAFEKKIKLKLNKNNFLVTFHPETSDKSFSLEGFNNMLGSINKIKDSTYIFTLSNADAESGKINKKIINFVKNNRSKSVYFSSMGQDLYYSALKNCNIVIGNSSSAIIEAPYFNTPSVNIGDRQKGRLSAKSIINTGTNKKSILDGIMSAIEINKNIKNKKVFDNPYGKYKSSKKIITILKKINLNKTNTQKIFYDINQ
ncbi:UDP-N-acetylglucosamine 2-epimerase [Candidatus Pelagibacter bacterium nBUS_27]|uniref:UDP-N-acetylglucosamine 2-epimerase n=1 Tax=Candidatus Pelagibacter bacterium nBUS_27 TaxID=3374188 RepID=UPI003EB797B2